MKTKKIKQIIRACVYGIGYSIAGFLLSTLGFAFAVGFCRVFDLDTSWTNWIV